MNDEMFEELLESVREAGAIKRGEKKASRIFVLQTPSKRLGQETGKSKKEGRTPSHHYPL